MKIISKLKKSLKETIERNGLTRGCFLIFVILPTLFTAIYSAHFASSRYTSVTKFALRSENVHSGGSLELAAQIFSPGGSPSADAYIIQDYIYSPDILNELDKKLHLRDHYSDQSIDPLFRLSKTAPQEEFLAYWKKMVRPKYETDSGIIMVSVTAFNPKLAQNIGEAIIIQSEKLVNQINERAHQDALKMAYDEVKLAEKKVTNVRSNLKKFRDANIMIDPRATAESLQGLLSRLEGQAIEARAQLKQSLTYLREDSPQVKSLKLNLNAIEKQLDEEKQRLAGQSKHGEQLSSVVGEYEQLVVESEFAHQQYLSAMSSLEIARVKSYMKSRYIVAYQQPTLPEEPVFPRPIYHTIVIFFVSFMLFLIISFIIAGIREHAGF